MQFDLRLRHVRALEDIEFISLNWNESNIAESMTKRRGVDHKQGEVFLIFFRA